jgi:hypothetical protein
MHRTRQPYSPTRGMTASRPWNPRNPSRAENRRRRPWSAAAAARRAACSATSVARVPSAAPLARSSLSSPSPWSFPSGSCAPRPAGPRHGGRAGPPTTIELGSSSSSSSSSSKALELGGGPHLAREAPAPLKRPASYPSRLRRARSSPCKQAPPRSRVQTQAAAAAAAAPRQRRRRRPWRRGSRPPRRGWRSCDGCCPQRAAAPAAAPAAEQARPSGPGGHADGGREARARR